VFQYDNTPSPEIQAEGAEATVENITEEFKAAEPIK